MLGTSGAGSGDTVDITTFAGGGMDTRDAADDTGSTAGPRATGAESGSTTGTGSTGAENMDTSSDTTGDGVLGVADLRPGDLVITEVMWNPSCDFDNCEWIEVYNATPQPVNLLDLFIHDSEGLAGNDGRIVIDVLLGPGEYGMFTRDVADWPYVVQATAVYGPFPGLDNGSLENLTIRNSAGVVLDETPTFPLGQSEGRSWTFRGADVSADANDDPGLWCMSGEPLATLDERVVEFGSPLAAHSACQS